MSIDYTNEKEARLRAVCTLKKHQDKLPSPLQVFRRDRLGGLLVLVALVALLYVPRLKDLATCAAVTQSSCGTLHTAVLQCLAVALLTL